MCGLDILIQWSHGDYQSCVLLLIPDCNKHFDIKGRPGSIFFFRFGQNGEKEVVSASARQWVFFSFGSFLELLYDFLFREFYTIQNALIYCTSWVPKLERIEGPLVNSLRRIPVSCRCSLIIDNNAYQDHVSTWGYR